MIARRSPAAKVSAPPPAVAKVPVDAPVPKVIVPIGAPFLWTSSTIAAVALTPAKAQAPAKPSAKLTARVSTTWAKSAPLLCVPGMSMPTS